MLYIVRYSDECHRHVLLLILGSASGREFRVAGFRPLRLFSRLLQVGVAEGGEAFQFQAVLTASGKSRPSPAKQTGQVKVQ